MRSFWELFLPLLFLYLAFMVPVGIGLYANETAERAHRKRMSPTRDEDEEQEDDWKARDDAEEEYDWTARDAAEED